MSKTATAAAPAPNGGSERDEFVKYLLRKGNISADECTIGGGMGGAFRPVQWFIEHWKDFADRSSIDAKWMGYKLKEFGFEPRAQNYQKKMVRGFKISAAMLSACGGVGDSPERAQDNPKFLNPNWLRNRARELGLQIQHGPFGSTIFDHNNHGNPIEAITPEVWQQVEDHFDIKSNRPITRENDGELTIEEQADLLEAQMFLRGGAVQIHGATVKLRGLLMRPNALLNADKIDAALAEVEVLVRNGRQQLAKIRAA